MKSPHLTSKSSEPEAYRIGSVPFLGATIFLDSHPLIPRTETEWWVEQCISTAQRERPLRVLDLFSGSGCIGIAFLLRVQNSTADFGEFDARHIPTIQKSIAENHIAPSRARVFQTDVYSAINGTYDYVLANPPYLSRARIERIEASVLEHEPVGALFAEDDGFALISATIQDLPAHLAQGGQAWIEHEPEHEQRIQEAASRLGLTAETHRDQYGLIRYSVILNS